jgi:SAM-dependent methyltransferase
MAHSFFFPHMPVEAHANKIQLEQLFKRVHSNWEHLGNTDPYWSVVTQPEYKKNNFSAHQDAFFNSGRQNVELILATLRRYEINTDSFKKCLEFGCGVGRVTMHLAPLVKELFAYDISAPHLQYLRELVKERELSNVMPLQLMQLQDLQAQSQIDLVVSLITLQHNTPPLIVYFLKILLKTLSRKGVAVIQIPTYCNGYIFEIERYLNTPQGNELEVHFVPQNIIFEILRENDCICLEVREDPFLGDSERTLSNTFLIQKR